MNVATNPLCLFPLPRGLEQQCTLPGSTNHRKRVGGEVKICSVHLEYCVWIIDLLFIGILNSCK